MQPRMTDAAGWPVRLERELAAGGEGAVWIVADRPDRVAKVYDRPLSEDGARKLNLLIARATPELLTIAGWPTDLLAASGLVAGFLMPRFDGYAPIQQLYNPARRHQQFPLADWRFLVRAAHNCAVTFDRVHRAGCVVADVNQSNVLVDAEGRIALIDCDSFQITSGQRTFPCNVGVPAYTPPELQGCDFHGLPRTANHDAFGLAVLIFQILMQGRHPFAGIWQGEGDMPIERAIAEGRFAFGGGAAAMHIDRPPHAPSLDDLPMELSALFERAFGRFERRPSPGEWVDQLDAMARCLVPCPDRPAHWLVRARGRCPWCAIAGSGGPDYFVHASAEDDTFRLQSDTIDELARRIEADPLCEFALEPAYLAPPAAPTPLPDATRGSNRISPTLLAAACLGLTYTLISLGTPTALTIGLPITAIFGSMWVLVEIRSERWREWRRRRAAVRQAAAALRPIRLEWRRLESGPGRTAREMQSLLRAELAELRGMEAGFVSELSRLSSHRDSLGRIRRLQSQFIVDAGIPKLSARQARRLASLGMETAFDIEDWRLREIDGIGEGLRAALLEWKQQISEQVQPAQADAAIPGPERQVLIAEFRRSERAAIERLKAGIDELETLSAKIRDTATGLTAAMRPLADRWRRAEGDFAIYRRAAI